MYRVPFVSVSFAICFLFLFKTNKPLPVRLFPLLFLGSFSALYNYHVGQYGVYKNIDSFMKILSEKGDTEVGSRTREFLTLLKDERDN